MLLQHRRFEAYGDPGWVEISWDEALTEIADRPEAIRSENGAEAVTFAVTPPSGTPIVDSFEWVGTENFTILSEGQSQIVVPPRDGSIPIWTA